MTELETDAIDCARFIACMPALHGPDHRRQAYRPFGAGAIRRERRLPGSALSHLLVDEPIQEVDSCAQTVKERTTTDAGRYSARMHVGEAFVSEINLRA